MGKSWAGGTFLSHVPLLRERLVNTRDKYQMKRSDTANRK
jgi:hypothetical protein